jgi:ABC-2 type transport system permease protein
VTGLLRGELIKLRTTRTALGFGALVLLLVLAGVLLLALLGDPISIEDKRQVVTVVGLGATIPVVLVLFGVVGATGEHRHGTITSALLIAPDRIRVTLAKLLAYAAAGALVALVVQAIALLVGLPLLADQPGPDLAGSDLRDLFLGGMVACGLAAALGVAVGALVRNQVAAVVGALAYLFILEPIVGAVSDTVAPYTVGGTVSAVAGLEFSSQLDPLPAGLVLLAWTVVVGTVAVLADRVRDVN